MEFLLLWIAGLAVFVYLVAPLIFKFKQRFGAVPQFQPVDLATLPEPAAHYLWSCQQALEAEGFTTIAHLSWANSAPNVFPIVSLLMNRTTGVKAVVGRFMWCPPRAQGWRHAMSS